MQFDSRNPWALQAPLPCWVQRLIYNRYLLHSAVRVGPRPARRQTGLLSAITCNYVHLRHAWWKCFCVQYSLFLSSHRSQYRKRTVMQSCKRLLTLPVPNNCCEEVLEHLPLLHKCSEHFPCGHYVIIFLRTSVNVPCIGILDNMYALDRMFCLLNSNIVAHSISCSETLIGSIHFFPTEFFKF